MRDPVEEGQATLPKVKMGECLVKCFPTLGLLPQIVDRTYVSGVSSVSNENSHLCGSFDSDTSLSESGCNFCIP